MTGLRWADVNYINFQTVLMPPYNFDHTHRRLHIIHRRTRNIYSNFGRLSSTAQKLMDSPDHS